MNEINKQVSRARRRMITGKFFSILVWAVFISLVIALVGIAIPKIWHLGFLEAQPAQDAWLYSWIIGSVVVGLVTTAVLTWRSRGTHVDTAVEVDRRFGLKARLSSALNLSSTDAGSSAGQALLRDAQQRAEDIDVADQFRFKPTWHALLPIAPVVLLLALFFVPNAQKVVAEDRPAFDKEQVELQVREFKKKVEEKRKQLEAKGLDDASQELKSLGKKFDKLLSEPSTSQKDIMVKLNDIKKEIADRRKKIGDAKDFKKELNKLKNVGKGPAKKLASAIGDGDFEKAKEALKELAKRLKDGKMDREGVRELAKDLNKLAEAIKKAAENREREIDELKDKVEKAKQAGDLDKAAKLQAQLEQKQEQNQQMKKMDDLAKKLQECAACMKPGEGKGGKPQDGDAEQAMKDLKKAMQEAGGDLEDIAQQMEELQKQLEEMEALEDLEDAADECKGQCQGEGQGGKDGKPKWSDWAKGAGKGKGLRDQEESDTGKFKARVKAKLGKGETVVTGTADGKNITGRSVSEAKELVRSTMDRDVDPLENQKLTKKQLEHAKQYFKALREQ